MRGSVGEPNGFGSSRPPGSSCTPGSSRPPGSSCPPGSSRSPGPSRRPSEGQSSGSDGSPAGLAAHRSDGAALLDLVARGGVTVLSGAGLSTESGIPDYRGADGMRRVTPMQYREFVGSSDARRRYWARSYLGWPTFASARPNAGHVAVARLVRLGVVDAVVTQNVDRLHHAAGTDDALELHGALAEVVCLDCDDRTARHEVQRQMRTANPDVTPDGPGTADPDSGDRLRPDGDLAIDEADIASFVAPRCRRCNSDRVKPDVVFFGETVPPERVSRARAVVANAAALLVLGSSLAVMSGYRFVRQAAGDGIPIGIVTRGATRGDAVATVRLDASLGPTLTELVETIEQRV